MKVEQSNSAEANVALREPFKWKYSIPRKARKQRKDAKNKGKSVEFKQKQLQKIVDQLENDKMFAGDNKLDKINRKIARIKLQMA